MQLRRFAAVSAALVASAAALTPVIAQADTPSTGTLYVNNASNSNCSDSAGLGTQAEPFCTIQAAVNVVNPGQTVSVEYGVYAPATITRSGTAAAPITIVGVPSERASITALRNKWQGTALSITGASYLNISGFALVGGSSGALVISGGSHITVDSVRFFSGAVAPNAIVDVTGASQAVTIQRTAMPLLGNTTAAIDVEGGSTGTVLSTNSASSSGTQTLFSVNDAPDTVIVSNSLHFRCQTAVALSQGSTNAVIENNVVENGLWNCTGSTPLISADATAAPTATDDYNSLRNVAVDYGWGGTNYATPSQFSAATGQGAHDFAYGASQSADDIDSANSAAPGELPTDLYGEPRVDDPLVPNTGAGPFAYYDRGAVETQEPVNIQSYTASSLQAPTGSTLTFTAKASSTWSSTLTYTFDFGDGSTQTNTTGVTTHTYPTDGSYKTSVTVTGESGFKTSTTYPVAIVPPAPLAATWTVDAAGALSAVATAQSTDSWDVTGYSFDFGDGSSPVTRVPGVSVQASHVYPNPGTYTITMTVVDSGGNSTKLSEKFTTAGSTYVPDGPVRVLDTRHGIGTGGVAAKLGPNQTLHLKIAGNGDIPSNASAVAFNLTVTNPTAGGDIVAFPDGQSMPATSNLNFVPGLTKATNVIVGIGPDGDVSLYNGSAGTVDLVADVNGYFIQENAYRYTPMSPIRILDTRHAIGTGGVTAKIGAGKTLTLWITNGQDVPLPGVSATAVVLNLTAVNEATGGYVTAYPDGSARPLASSLNFGAGQVVPNTVIVPVGNDGKIDLYNGSGGPIDLVADLQGYFGLGGGDAYVPTAPQRLFDSRTSAGGGPFSSGGRSSVELAPLATTPYDFGLSPLAYVYNVTVTQTTGSGYVSVFPVTAQNPPVVSNLNFTAGQTTANNAITAVTASTTDDTFAVTFTQPASSTQLIVDMFGYFSGQ